MDIWIIFAMDTNWSKVYASLNVLVKVVKDPGLLMKLIEQAMYWICDGIWIEMKMKHMESVIFNLSIELKIWNYLAVAD